MQHPATGPKLDAAIRNALNCLEEYRLACDFEWESCIDADAALWRTLLIRTKEGGAGGAVRLLRRDDLGIPARVALTGRRWDQFQRWFAKRLLARQFASAKASGASPLYGARLSDGRGGHAESAEALYFLSFDPPSQDPSPSATAQHRQSAPGQTSSSHESGAGIALGFLLGAACMLLIRR